MLGWRSVELGLIESGRGLGRLLGLAIGTLDLMYSVRRIDDDITDLEVARAQLMVTVTTATRAPQSGLAS